MKASSHDDDDGISVLVSISMEHFGLARFSIKFLVTSSYIQGILDVLVGKSHLGRAQPVLSGCTVGSVENGLLILPWQFMEDPGSSLHFGVQMYMAADRCST